MSDGARIDPACLLGRLADGDCGDEILAPVLAALRRAGRPVSVPGLCNVLWFGQDDAGEYVDGPALSSYTSALARFNHEVREAGKPPPAKQDAVPLGAIIGVELGGDEAWGEVIWKEGAHPAVCDGDHAWAPGWLSGMPSGGPEDGPPGPDFAPPPGPRTLRERVVVDFHCLGADLPPTDKQLTRLRSRGRRLDCYGHLVAPAAYDDGMDEADEVSFWAAWTVAHHADALAAAGVPASARRLAEAATVLAAALDQLPEVRSFGPYYFDADLYARIIEFDTRNDGPLGHVVSGLRQVPRHERVGFASMSTRLAETAETDDPATAGWPTAVVCASLRALDVLATEAADGDWNGVHVRLDDPWQGGGLWRAERLEGTTPVNAGPQVALGLGWVAYTGGTIDRVPDTRPGQGGDDVDDLDWDITDTEATWTTHLSPADVDHDRLQVPERIAAAIAATLHTFDREEMLVVVRHDGEADHRYSSPLDERALRVEWPLGVWVATTVRAAWTVGSRKVVAATRLLAAPEDVGGITYTHEFNLAVALAAAGLAERATGTATLPRLVRAVVRRHGAVTEDGAMALPISDVVTYCFGPSGEVFPGNPAPVLRRAVLNAVGTMRATGAAHLEGDLVIVADRHTLAGRRADAELVSRFVDWQHRRLREAGHTHFVPATVVNLPAGWSRSAAKDAGYHAVAGTDYLPEGGLRPGQTWRRRHTRGSGVAPALAADVRRAAEAIRMLDESAVGTATLDNAATDLSRLACLRRPGRSDEENARA